ncbi:class I SAM-dependent methyltransferase [Tropicimonas sp. IMCC6043]|uniref:class I SAM-dependent methyltransferase n=1 Tax=Tropicimonas sp. IMCC6043 TaxID=2510645 RepID=UPI00101C9A98|nr:methyltransferase domain-containing protein [Tropicimonas sp. IMCC6043]RYH05849.1 methyltransferase domain-containing protein [Tropicimonas sp. IMCC6043]
MTDNAMWEGDSYDLLMGRWSRLLAPSFVDFASVTDGDHVLEVGCGTGSLTRAVLDAGPEVLVTGIDGSADYIEINRTTTGDNRATLEQGDAQALSYQDNSFNGAVSLLVMNFVPDPAGAVTEMKRVTRTGGYVAAAVWDYGDGMLMLRHLWDEAAAMDADAEARHERNMPLCRDGELAALWRECGLRNVTDTGLTIQMNFSSFDDYWKPFLNGPGPSGAYVSGLDAAAQARLRNRLYRKLAGGSEETPFSLSARAWAVRGRVDD